MLKIAMSERSVRTKRLSGDPPCRLQVSRGFFLVHRLNSANYPGAPNCEERASEQMPPLLISATCDLCLTYVVHNPQ